MHFVFRNFPVFQQGFSKAWQIATPVCDPSMFCAWRTVEVHLNSLPIQWAVIHVLINNQTSTPDVNSQTQKLHSFNNSHNFVSLFSFVVGSTLSVKYYLLGILYLGP